MVDTKYKAAMWDLFWNTSIGGLAIVDAHGTFIKANPAFCKIVEYSEPELQEIGFTQITSPFDAAHDLAMAEETRLGKRDSYDMVKSYITKRGNPVWVHLRVSRFEVNGEFQFFISQVYEVPAPIVNMLAPEGSGNYILSRARAKFKFPWEQIKEYGTIATIAILGGAYILAEVAPRLVQMFTS